VNGLSKMMATSMTKVIVKVKLGEAEKLAVVGYFK
jgi:hypothetical protein